MSNSIMLLHTRLTGAVCVLLLSLATYGQQKPSLQPQSGKDLKVDGTIAERSAETLTLVTLAGERVEVMLAPATRIVESDTGKSYSDKAIFPGLYVSVSGRTNSTGQLVAESVAFTHEDLKLASMIDARVSPLEQRLGSIEGRIGQVEQNAQRLSGQLDELATVSNAARGGSRAAQETADAAVAGVNAVNERLNASGLGVPRFPWPPPKASATAVIPRRFLTQEGASVSLADVSNRLEAALEGAEYTELGWYAVPGGFAVASRIEQFRPDGTPARGQDRWLVSNTPPIYGLSDYLTALFTANPGNYRVIVFIVTDQPLVNSDVTVGDVEAMAWVNRGASTIPNFFTSLPFSAGHTCTALIYQFRRTVNNPPAFVDASGLTGRQHLQRSGIWGRLER